MIENYVEDIMSACSKTTLRFESFMKDEKLVRTQALAQTRDRLNDQHVEELRAKAVKDEMITLVAKSLAMKGFERFKTEVIDQALQELVKNPKIGSKRIVVFMVTTGDGLGSFVNDAEFAIIAERAFSFFSDMFGPIAGDTLRQSVNEFLSEEESCWTFETSIDNIKDIIGAAPGAREDFVKMTHTITSTIKETREGRQCIASRYAWHATQVGPVYDLITEYEKSDDDEDPTLFSAYFDRWVLDEDVFDTKDKAGARSIAILEDILEDVGMMIQRLKAEFPLYEIDTEKSFECRTVDNPSSTKE